ncbi:MAG: hypothetical protein LBV34_23480 [Nocardiopsaceae bacterium]|jgi:hypothetical protein|nr:hypothetical protein [Nocardiopsaceae bacterium]
MEFICRRCKRPVRTSAEHFEVFEQMHYVCFHYEFEHREFDVDDECSAGGCPSASLANGRGRVISTARELVAEAASEAPWSNDTLPTYLDAFAAWLADSGGYHLNRRTVLPGNGWEVVNDALRAARDYKWS